MSFGQLSPLSYPSQSLPLPPSPFHDKNKNRDQDQDQPQPPSSSSASSTVNNYNHTRTGQQGFHSNTSTDTHGHGRVVDSGAASAGQEQNKQVSSSSSSSSSSFPIIARPIPPFLDPSSSSSSSPSTSTMTKVKGKPGPKPKPKLKATTGSTALKRKASESSLQSSSPLKKQFPTTSTYHQTPATSLEATTSSNGGASGVSNGHMTHGQSSSNDYETIYGNGNPNLNGNMNESLNGSERVITGNADQQEEDIRILIENVNVRDQDGSSYPSSSQPHLPYHAQHQHHQQALEQVQPTIPIPSTSHRPLRGKGSRGGKMMIDGVMVGGRGSGSGSGRGRARGRGGRDFEGTATGVDGVNRSVEEEEEEQDLGEEKVIVVDGDVRETANEEMSQRKEGRGRGRGRGMGRGRGRGRGRGGGGGKSMATDFDDHGVQESSAGGDISLDPEEIPGQLRHGEAEDGLVGEEDLEERDVIVSTRPLVVGSERRKDGEELKEEEKEEFRHQEKDQSTLITAANTISNSTSNPLLPSTTSTSLSNPNLPPNSEIILIHDPSTSLTRHQFPFENGANKGFMELPPVPILGASSASASASRIGPHDLQENRGEVAVEENGSGLGSRDEDGLSGSGMFQDKVTVNGFAGTAKLGEDGEGAFRVQGKGKGIGKGKGKGKARSAEGMKMTVNAGESLDDEMEERDVIRVGPGRKADNGKEPVDVDMETEAKAFDDDADLVGHEDHSPPSSTAINSNVSSLLNDSKAHQLLPRTHTPPTPPTLSQQESLDQLDVEATPEPAPELTALQYQRQKDTKEQARMGTRVVGSGSGGVYVYKAVNGLSGRGVKGDVDMDAEDEGIEKELWCEGEECFLWTDLPMCKQGFRYVPCSPSPNDSPSHLTHPFYRTLRQASGPMPPLPGQKLHSPHPLITSPPVHLDWVDRSPYLKLSSSALTVTTDKGFRSVRANCSVRQGAWYFEVIIERGGGEGCVPGGRLTSNGEIKVQGPSMQGHGSQSFMSDGAHVRLGWARREASLNGPCGLDGYSYGIRDSTGDKVTLSRPKAYGKPFGTGDVIGCMIYIPEPTPAENEEKQKAREDDEWHPSKVVRKRIPIRYKDQLYFEMVDYATTREMDGMVARDGKAALMPSHAVVTGANGETSEDGSSPPRNDLLNGSPARGVSKLVGSPAKKAKAPGAATKNTVDGKAGKAVKRGRKKQQNDEPPPSPTVRSVPVIQGSQISFYLNGKPMNADEPAFRDIFDFLPLKQTAAEIAARLSSKRLNFADAVQKERENPFDDATLGYYPFLSCFGGARARLNPGPHWTAPVEAADWRLGQNAETGQTREPLPVCHRWDQYIQEETLHDEEEEARLTIRLLKEKQEDAERRAALNEQATLPRGNKPTRGKGSKAAKNKSSRTGMAAVVNRDTPGSSPGPGTPFSTSSHLPSRLPSPSLDRDTPTTALDEAMDTIPLDLKVNGLNHIAAEYGGDLDADGEVDEDIDMDRL